MKRIPDEIQIEEMLTTSSLHFSRRLEQRLSNAPWTERAVARRRFVSTTAIVALLLAVLVAVTPQGRAFAQSLLRLFIRADGDTIPVPTMPMAWVEVTPGIPNPTLTAMPTETPLAAFAEECGSFPIMSCSVEQIRSKVDFIVKEPASIPEGLYFTGATGGPDDIYLRYEYENNSGALFITEERWTGTPDQGNPRIGASTVVEDVQVGKLPGEYFKGSFVQNGNANDAVAKWDSNASLETLRWVDGGVSYTFQYSYTDQGPLGKEKLIEIAETLTTTPVAKLPMPATPTAIVTVHVNPDLMSLKINLAERQAGFNLMMPPRLPAELTSHGGASFNRATGVVSVWFTYDDVNMNGLYLHQQVISDPDACVLCDAVVGDDHSALLTQGPEIVGASANLQTVQIGDVTGKYFTGVRKGSGEWDPLPDMQHLRWQANDRGFELISLGTGLQKEDLIAIAESLTLETSTPTPEASDVWNARDFWNLSLSEAEQQAGYKLILPGTMPEILPFFGARYNADDKTAQVYYQIGESLMGPNGNGLVITQQVIADPSHCGLCDISIGDLNSQKEHSDYVLMVPLETDLEIVQIGGVTSKYAHGNWLGTDCCGWVWDSNTFTKFIRWQKDGKAFELFYTGDEMQKEDLIRIAESMK